jgi:Bacterial Ig-like domain
MDRRSRRFVPSSEGLEGRQLLSTAVANQASSVSTNPASTAPVGTQVDGAAPIQQTIEAKRHHIENLPFFIGMLNKDGVVPQPAVKNIQDDLLNELAQLNIGNSSLVSSFNLDLRKAEAFENITPTLEADLNRDFGAVLVATGVNAKTTADLQKQLALLVDYDSTQVGSTIAATNDYGTVLQLALQSGRPLVFPDVPALLGTDHTGNNGKIPITHNHRPSLTGSYAIGTNIEIVDVHNRVILGRGRVDPTTGVYTVQFNDPLPDGTYTVRTRAEDSAYVSQPSPKFTFEVVTPPPAKK